MPLGDMFFNFLRHIRFFMNTPPTPTFCTRIVWSNHQLWIISSCTVQNLCVLVKLTLWLLLEHPKLPNPVLSPQSSPDTLHAWLVEFPFASEPVWDVKDDSPLAFVQTGFRRVPAGEHRPQNRCVPGTDLAHSLCSLPLIIFLLTLR